MAFSFPKQILWLVFLLIQTPFAFAQQADSLKMDEMKSMDDMGKMKSLDDLNLQQMEKTLSEAQKTLQPKPDLKDQKKIEKTFLDFMQELFQQESCASGGNCPGAAPARSKPSEEAAPSQ